MTPQQQAPPPPDHDLTLPYHNEIVPGSALNLDRWQWWSHTDAGIVYYYAKGPCPACHADTQDRRADVLEPIEGLGRFRRGRDTPPVPTETVDMPVRCRCGSDHGQPDAGGCGRRWLLIIGPRATTG